MALEILNPLRWKKSVLFSLLVAFVLVWFTFIDVYSLKTRWELNQRKKELVERTQDLHVKSDVLKVKLESLENDPALWKKLRANNMGCANPAKRCTRLNPKSDDLFSLLPH